MSFAFKYNYPQVARDCGFKLRNYKDGPLDWHLMGSVEVERVLRDQCLEQIDSVLDHLSEAPLGSILETNILDGGIAKYFVISQFSIQYLLFCRKFLEETVADLRETHGSSQIEVVTLKRSLSEANNEILQLHKRITQMEAIHEVIYPCHLCTKNFVSNDALNLHISRKHNAVSAKHEDRIGMETPVTSAKEREHDLTLINTIKLELEIKHLKERLNNAEKKIKDRDVTPTSHRSDFEKSEKPATICVGIQSNLSEIKEHDEQSGNDAKHFCENTGQISDLQDKLQDLHQWREEQRIQNSDFLAEINSKLKELSNAMEAAQNEKEQKLDNGTMAPSTSMDDLDALLNRKVEDIGKTTAAKLDDVVSKMELNYKNKLEELEKELFKIASEANSVNRNVHDDHPNREISLNDSHHIVSKDSPDDDHHSREIRLNDSHHIVIKDSAKKNHTEAIVNKAKSLEDDVLALPISSEKSNASSSSHTFVKSKSDTNLEKLSQEEDQPQKNADEFTDVSGGNLDDDDGVSTTKLSKNKRLSEKHGSNPSSKPKPVTRKESKMLVNSRLCALGINMKTNSLTHSSMKHISNELSQRRNKLKEKHPNFYATRNKIKKFVDKLCSSKMPENAQTLLRVTRPKQLESKETSTKHRAMSYSPSSDEEEEVLVSRVSKASTPFADSNSMHNTEFKHRLESILASPIRKPDELHLKAEIQQQQPQHKLPIPMPRKRVMFNQAETKLNETLSISESESEQHLEKQYHHKAKAHVLVHKAPMASSLSSFL